MHSFRTAVLLMTFALSFASVSANAQRFQELPPNERNILAPLSGDWDAMSATQKKKWRELAERFPKLSLIEQERISNRMHGWSQMSPHDRRQARDQFRELNRQQAGSAPANREALKSKWAEYRDLPAEQRDALREAQIPAGAVRATAPNTESVKRSGIPPLPSSQVGSTNFAPQVSTIPPAKLPAAVVREPALAPATR